MPVSISSNICVRQASSPPATIFRISNTRESSPPDAALDNGQKPSPLLAASRKLILSAPTELDS